MGDGCEQDRRIDVKIDQWGAKLAVPFFLFLPFSGFSPFLEASTAEKLGENTESTGGWEWLNSRTSLNSPVESLGFAH